MRAGISLGAAQTPTSNVNTGDTEVCRDIVLAGSLMESSIGTTS
jgi:hypothetical protein